MLGIKYTCVLISIKEYHYFRGFYELSTYYSFFVVTVCGCENAFYIKCHFFGSVLCFNMMYNEIEMYNTYIEEE